MVLAERCVVNVQFVKKIHDNNFLDLKIFANVIFLLDKKRKIFWYVICD